MQRVRKVYVCSSHRVAGEPNNFTMELKQDVDMGEKAHMAVTSTSIGHSSRPVTIGTRRAAISAPWSSSSSSAAAALAHGHLHTDGLAVEIGVVEIVHGICRVLLILELDEGKARACTRDINIGKLPELTKMPLLAMWR